MCCVGFLVCGLLAALPVFHGVWKRGRLRFSIELDSNRDGLVLYLLAKLFIVLVLMTNVCCDIDALILIFYW